MVDSETNWSQDFAAGCLTALVGIGAIAVGRNYGIGTLQQMEPGFFPVALGVILGGLGISLGVSALRRRSSGDGGHGPLIASPDWRGWGFIVGGVLSFLLLGRTLGMAPAAFACVFISALGDRTMNVKRAAILALCVTVLGSVLFSVILKVQMPLVAWKFL